MPENPYLALLCEQLQGQEPLSEAAGLDFVNQMSFAQQGELPGGMWDMLFTAIHLGYGHRPAPGFGPVPRWI